MRNPPRVLHLALAAACAVVFAAPPLLAQARTPAPTKDSAQVVYDDDGLRIHSADGTKQIKIRGYLTADVRTVLNDTNDASSNGIAMRRARVIFDANLNSRVAMRVMYDVAAASGPSPIQDAYVDIGLGGTWWLRGGKQKTPVGLERYMSISSQILPERSLASNMEGGRDLGFLLTGSVAEEHLELSLGVFNGAADGGATQDTDANDDKDITYRVWWKPVRKKVNGAEQGFGLAYDGSTGIERSSGATGAKLPTYKTPAQISFFSYAEGSGVKATGRHSQNNVFAHFHDGAFGTMAEWFGNTQVVSKGVNTTTVNTGAWVGTLQYTLTGEPSQQEGIVPKTVFDYEKGNWGAWQVGVRAAQVHVGDEAFPLYADSTVAPRRALELGASINWFMTRQTKVQLAYEHTTFEGGAKVGNRRTERYVQLRWQAYF
ncbi:MAG: porin [Gemmatimonadetes bacterium]|nr:porin [Gemmatimonadota bacterium]